MPVAEQSTITRYTTNGTTATFAAGFAVASAAEISVYIDDVLQSTTLWSYSGGNIVFVTTPPSGSVVSIQRVTPLERETSYTNSTNQFLPSVLDADLDRIWLALQDLKSNTSRALALPISETSNPTVVLSALRQLLIDFDAIAPLIAATADAEALLRSYIDGVIINVSFPLDCGLISDPVINNRFDLGAL
jgi:hypothetical protein